MQSRFEEWEEEWNNTQNKTAIHLPNDTELHQCLATSVTLKPHQEEGIQWMFKLFSQQINGILADDMGLGKTLQVIGLLSYLITVKKEKGPFLIIGPLTITQNWTQEIQKFAPHLNYTLFIGNKLQREEMKETISESMTKSNVPFELLVTSYDMILSETHFLSTFSWKILIVDEAHRLKNSSSVLYTTLQTHFQFESCFLLTGTPVQNNMTELWSLLHFIMPKLFSSKEDFLHDFPETLFTETFQQEEEEEEVEEIEQRDKKRELLFKLLKPFLLRRMKSEVIKDLPSKTESILYTKLTRLQRELYRKLVLKDGDIFANSFQSKNRLANMLMNLRKCCNHPYLFDGVEPEPYKEGEHLVFQSGKMILLDKLLVKMHQLGHKCLLFSQMTSMLDLVQDYLTFRKFSYERLDGSVRGEERFAAISNFSQENVFCFLLSTRAGGVGLNLIAANVVIFIDNDFNPQMDKQAQERVYRIGQTKPVKVFRLVTEDTVEQIMLQRAFLKLQLSLNVMEKQSFSSLQSEDSGDAMSASKLQSEDILKMIRFGLHKVIQQSEENIDEQLLNLNIDEILDSGHEVSLQEQLQSQIGASNSLETSNGMNLSHDEKDEEALKQLLSSNESIVKLKQIVPPKQRVSKPKTQRPVKEPEKKKRKSYISHAIVIPEVSSSQEMDIKDSLDMDDSNLLDMNDSRSNRRLHPIIGDVTKPIISDDSELNQKPKIIVFQVSDYGHWGRGGLFTQISNLSDEPAQIYENAKKNEDLNCGDVHLVTLDDNLYLALIVVQHYDEESGVHGGLEMDELEICLEKVYFAATNLNATVHLPRIGWGLPGFDYYATERIIKKCLSAKGIHTFIYYFKRNNAKPSSTSSSSTSPARHTVASTSPNTSSNHQSSVENTADDLFEDFTIALYYMEEQREKAIRSLILANGGVVTKDIHHKNVQVIVTALSVLNSELDKLLQEKHKIIVNEEWVRNCINNSHLYLSEEETLPFRIFHSEADKLAAMAAVTVCTE